jgi:hypothetical protein
LRLETGIDNASAVKIINAMSSLMRFSKTKHFLLFKNTPAYYNTGVVVLN